jgi:hypothetical protein
MAPFARVRKSVTSSEASMRNSKGVRIQSAEQAARSDARCELRDLAESMVMVSRVVTSALEVRSNLERRLPA